MGRGFDHLALRIAGAFLCATASYYLWERTFIAMGHSQRRPPVAIPRSTVVSDEGKLIT